ncbi:MAG: OmpH family outer membrane protein [Bacteroidota bacterium]
MTKSIKIMAALVLFATSCLYAQSPKFGHVNSTQLLSMMPETKVADSALQKFGSSLEGQLKTMNAEYDNKVTEYKEKQSSMAEPIQQAKAKEISDLGDRIQDFQQSAQSSIQKKKEELYQPIIKKAEDAIHGIGKEKGYTYIFDSGVGVLLYFQDSEDIMSLVKTKLSLK